MRTLIYTLFLSVIANYSFYANAQTVNNATVNLQGTSQNVNITQLGSGHSATINLSGDSVSIIANQSGTIPQSFNFSVTCGSSCPSSPYYITQY